MQTETSMTTNRVVSTCVGCRWARWHADTDTPFMGDCSFPPPVVPIAFNVQRLWIFVDGPAEGCPTREAVA
jgi:hypothetical protein